MKQEALEQARAAYAIEAQCIEEALSYFDDAAFSAAVAALAKAPRIGAAGCGHSGIACRHFAHLMCCIERPARFISPAEAVHGAMGFVQPGDVMLLASRGGKTQELIPILAMSKQKNVFVISVTENLQSPMASTSEFVLATLILTFLTSKIDVPAGAKDAKSTFPCPMVGKDDISMSA